MRACPTAGQFHLLEHAQYEYVGNGCCRDIEQRVCRIKSSPAACLLLRAIGKSAWRFCCLAHQRVQPIAVDCHHGGFGAENHAQRIAATARYQTARLKKMSSKNQVLIVSNGGHGVREVCGCQRGPGAENISSTPAITSAGSATVPCSCRRIVSPGTSGSRANRRESGNCHSRSKTIRIPHDRARLARVQP